MKVISKEEEAAHYAQVVRGGVMGGSVGGLVGLGSLLLAQRRYAGVRNLTIQFKAFLLSSAATAGAITTAERYSVRFQRAKDPMNFYKDQSERAAEGARKVEGAWQRFVDFGRENRYQIVLVSWLVSMALALTIVGRNKYLTTAQKLVQARVYAQGLTVAVLLGSAGFETFDAQAGKGRWETVMVLDPNDPEHKHLIEKRIHHEEYEGQDLWKDMVAAEERRIEARKAAEGSPEEHTDKQAAGGSKAS